MYLAKLRKKWSWFDLFLPYYHTLIDLELMMIITWSLNGGPYWMGSHGLGADQMRKSEIEHNTSKAEAD